MDHDYLKAGRPHLLLAVTVLALAFAPAAAQQVTTLKPAGRLGHQFSSITGLRELPDGRVLVSDGTDGVLVRADFATQRLDTLGREGQGPGEYKAPDLLLPLPDGATLLLDLGNARLTVFDASGRYRESLPIAQGTPAAGPGGLRLILPRASDRQGRLYFQPMGGGPRADSAPVLRWDRSRGTTDTVGRVKLPSMVTRTSGGSNTRSTAQRPRPYPEQDGWAVTADGRVALIRVPAYRVDWMEPNGQATRGPALPATQVRVGAGEKREYLDELATGALRVAVEVSNGSTSVRMARGSQGNDLPDPDEFEWPPVKPPVVPTSAFPASNGAVWVERSVPAGAPREYDVIGPSGAVSQRVALPVGRRLVGLGERFLYARQVDADGINWLERYQLP